MSNVKKQTSTRCRFEARLNSTNANSPICANDKPAFGAKEREIKG